MKIILTGYMGSGKTTIGKLLSEKTLIPFYDLDDLIISKEKKSINEIFESKGEIYFRKIENQVLHEFLKSQNNYILSLGGGTPCYADNHSIFKEKDICSIHLKASVNELVQRLKKELKHRPLLKKLSNENLLNDFIAKHLFERNYYYNQARNVINIDDKSAETIVEEIEKKLI